MDTAGVKDQMDRSMNKLMILCVFVLLSVGCGSAPMTRNTANANVSATPKMAEPATPVPPASPVPAEAMPRGTKVEKEQNVRFEGGAIPEGWQWIDPGSRDAPSPHQFKEAALVMTIPSGKDLYGANRTAPRLVKAVDGDFQIGAHIKFDPQQDYQGAGLLIYQDEDNYIRLERAFGGVDGGGSGIRLDIRKGSEYSTVASPIDIPTTSTQVELKITRRLNVLSAFWRDDEDGEWRLIEDVPAEYGDTVLAGVVGCSTADAITAEFSRIRLSPQPVTRPY